MHGGCRNVFQNARGYRGVAANGLIWRIPSKRHGRCNFPDQL